MLKRNIHRRQPAFGRNRGVFWALLGSSLDFPSVIFLDGPLAVRFLSLEFASGRISPHAGMLN